MANRQNPPQIIPPSGFYPYTWWAQLAPSEKQGKVLIGL